MSMCFRMQTAVPISALNVRAFGRRVMHVLMILNIEKRFYLSVQIQGRRNIPPDAGDL
jgi:hypothetical protein